MGEHYTHLDIRERAMIEMNLALGKRPAQIAVYLSRTRSTITREIARNGWHAAYYDRAAGGSQRAATAVKRPTFAQRDSAGEHGWSASSGRARHCGS
jgi:transposase, IS30 family